MPDKSANKTDRFLLDRKRWLGFSAARATLAGFNSPPVVLTGTIPAFSYA
jgi:hypothetical protein